MLREFTAVVLSTMAAIFVAAVLTISTTHAQQPSAQYSASTLETAVPIVVAAAKKKKYKYSPRRSGSGNFAGNGGGSTKLIPKGGCCQRVLNACATICNRVGGCTGNSDCSTNPN